MLKVVVSKDIRSLVVSIVDRAVDGDNFKVVVVSVISGVRVTFFKVVVVFLAGTVKGASVMIFLVEIKIFFFSVEVGDGETDEGESEVKNEKN